MGIGWNLSAYGIISRTPENHVFDDQVSPIEFDNNDKLTLDGQRLILFSGSNLATNSEYRTSIQSFQKITKESGNYFLVRQKDGMKRYYGETSASRVDVVHNGNNETAFWLLSKTEDRNGNQIRYDYSIDQASGKFRLERIRYAFVGETAAAEVEFHYSPRTDESVRHIAGHRFDKNLVLKKIVSKINSSEYSRFEFSYDWSTGVTADDFSRLVEIDYESQGTPVNSIIIQWHQPNVEYAIDASINPQYHASTKTSKRVIMDIDGDGIDDVLSLEYDKTEDGSCDIGLDFQGPITTYHHHYQLWVNTKNSGNGNFTRNQILGTFTSVYKPGECYRAPFCNIYPGDFNGDALSDFLLQRVEVGSNDRSRYYVDYYINNPGNPGSFTKEKTYYINDQLPYGFEQPQFDHTHEYAPQNYPFSLVVGDFDGDAITDFSYTAGLNPTDHETFHYMPTWKIVYTENTSPVTSQSFLNVQTWGQGRVDSAQIGDFNGDGKADIMFVNDLKAKIMYSEDRTTWKILYDNGFPNSYHFLKTADFNGDGISDIAYQNTSTTNDFHISYFDGSGFYPHIVPNVSYNLDLAGTQWNKPGYIDGEPLIFVRDVDGDGRADFVVIERNPSGSSDYNINIHYNKVTGWTLASHSLPPTIFTNRGDIKPYMFDFGDFKGSGDPQLIYYDKYINFLTSSLEKKAFNIVFRYQDKSAFVHQILDGFNRLTEFEFEPLSQIGSYAVDRVVSPYPNPSIIAPIPVTKSVKQWDFKTDGAGARTNLFNHQTYSYDNLRVNSTGLGFLGYQSVETLDHIQGVKQWASMNFVDFAASANPNLFLPQQNQTRLLSSTLLMSEKVDYATSGLKNNFANGEWQFAAPKVVLRESKESVRGVFTRENGLTYDSYGNTTGSTRETYSNHLFFGNPLITQTTTTTYDDQGSWIDWTPSTTTSTTTRDGEAAVSVSKSFEYFTNGNLKKEKLHPSTADEIVTTFAYDGYGNLTSEILDPDGGITPRTTSYAYTPDFRFVDTKTNPLGWVKDYDYYAVGGEVEQVTDENGLITSYQYDDFHRLTQTAFPDGNTEDIDRIWDAGTTFNQSLFYEEITGTNQPPSEKWFDGQLRKVRDKVKNQNDNWVFVQTIYNTKNEVWKKSLPYFNGGQKHFTTFTYDDYGRVISQASPTHTVTSSYSGLSTTVTNTATNQSTTKVLDVSGQVVSSTDAGGTINYHYNSWGKPRQIVGPSNTTTISYDALGFQNQLIDPAAGTMEYDYNNIGKLVRQEDAEGNVYEMEYDLLGRMTTKTGPDGIYTYLFDSQFKGGLDEAQSPYEVV